MSFSIFLRMFIYLSINWSLIPFCLDFDGNLGGSLLCDDLPDDPFDSTVAKLPSSSLIVIVSCFPRVVYAIDGRSTECDAPLLTYGV